MSSSSSSEHRPIARVLIVDDDRAVRISLAAVLDNEFIVQAVESSVAGRALVDSVHFDVVVTDFEMPGQDGLSFLDYIHQKNPATVGILLTGHVAHAKVNSAQKNWARYKVLIKPIDPLALIATVRASVHIARLRRSTARLSGRLNK